MTLRIVPNAPADACQMKMIYDTSVFPPEGIMHCQRFGNWGISDGISIEYRACSQHLHRVLRILYSEDDGPFSVIPLRPSPGA
jgi:hypothetical protein